MFREVVHRLLFHAIALRVDQLLVELGKALRGDVLFVVDFPDLILALVVEAGVFGIFDFDFELVELIGEPRGGGGRGVVMAAAILVDEVADVRVDDLRGQLGAVGLVGDVHQAAVGHALDAESAEERAEFRRALLIGEAAGGDGLGRRVGAADAREDAGADGLERQRFAGQNFGLRLDVIFEIEHVVVGIGALERQDVGGLAAEFDARRGDVDGLHAERGDRDDGDHREHEGQNQPLVLAEDEQVVPQVRFARRQIPGGAHAAGGWGTMSTVAALARHVARDHVEFVSHGSRHQPVDQNARADGGREFGGANCGLLTGAAGNVKNVGRAKLHVFGFEFHDFFQVDVDLLLLAGGVFADDDGAIGFRGACRGRRRARGL